MPKFLDLAGQRVHMLVVLYPVETPRGRRWLCQCDCGNQTKLITASITRKTTKSCGCYKYNKRPAGLSGAIKLFGHYKIDARRYKRVFELTFDEFYKLTSGNCFYCGIEPTNCVEFKEERLSQKGREHSSYKYNGIDRMNTKIGYVYDNCVSCCWDCNVAKHKKTLEEFLKWAKRLAHYQSAQRANVTKSELD